MRYLTKYQVAISTKITNKTSCVRSAGANYTAFPLQTVFRILSSPVNTFLYTVINEMFEINYTYTCGVVCLVWWQCGAVQCDAVQSSEVLCCIVSWYRVLCLEDYQLARKFSS